MTNLDDLRARWAGHTVVLELIDEIERLRHGIETALHRYDDPREKHNWEGGFLRGELAWAMANDLRKALADETG